MNKSIHKTNCRLPHLAKQTNQCRTQTQVELNQNGEIEVKETANPKAAHRDDLDGGTATVLSIHEHTNGSAHHDLDTQNSTSFDDSANADITADIADAEQLNNAIDVVQKEYGLNNSINADTAAVGFFKRTQINDQIITYLYNSHPFFPLVVDRYKLNAQNIIYSDAHAFPSIDIHITKITNSFHFHFHSV